LKRFLCGTSVMLLLAACSETPATSTAPGTPAAGACASVAGEWRGEKVGAGYQGPITIVIRENCNYVWTGTAGTITPGRLSVSSSGFSYANSAGSRGNVSLSGDIMTWVNSFTGNNYQVTVRR
jgi:hypothetical protein